MLTIDILASPDSHHIAFPVTDALEEAGFVCLHRREHEQDSNSLLVAILSPQDLALSDHYYLIGKQVGAGRPVLLIARGLEVPSTMQSLPMVDASSATLPRDVVTAVSKLLDVPTGEDPRPGQESWLSWLTAEPRRLEMLSASQLVEIVLLLFAGERQPQRSKGDSETDLIFQDSNSGLRWLVECKAPAASSPIGLETVLRVHSSCVSRRADVSVIVTNSRFTRAAEEWASRCVPSMRLVPRESLEWSLRNAISRKAIGLLDLPAMEYGSDTHSSETPQRSLSTNALNLHSRYTNRSDVANRILCIVWDSSENSSNASLVEQIKYSSTSLRVKAIELDIGQPDVVGLLPSALEDAFLVLVIPASYEKPVGSWSPRLWHRLAHNWPESGPPLCVVGHENSAFRLRLPSRLAKCSFIDPGEDPLRSVVRFLGDTDPDVTVPSTKHQDARPTRKHRR